MMEEATMHGNRHGRMLLMHSMPGQMKKREEKQLAQLWRDIKRNAKKDHSRFRRQRMGTGGGPEPAPLESLTEEIRDMIPQVFQPIVGVVDDDEEMEIPESGDCFFCHLRCMKDDARGGVSYTVGGAAAPPTSELPHQLFEVLIGFDLKMSVFISSETRSRSFETVGTRYSRKYWRSLEFYSVKTDSASCCPTNFARKAPPMDDAAFKISRYTIKYSKLLLQCLHALILKQGVHRV